MNCVKLITFTLVFLMTITVCFAANYGNQCSVEQQEEEKCGETETCCSRTVTSLDSEGNEIIEELSAGCCAYKDGVCCSEADGCCPNGYTCDSQNRRCLKQEPQDLTQPMIVSCPDGSICSSGQTCCLVSKTSYGCCPYDKATCCSDQTGCCPHGYICDSITSSCRGYLESIPMATPLESQRQSVATRSTEEEAEMLSLSKRWDGTYITCPNNSQCLSGHTCCKLDDASRFTTPYACCPFYEAICCKNSLYCCPQNRPCDPSTNQCLAKATRDVDAEAMPAYRMY